MAAFFSEVLQFPWLFEFPKGKTPPLLIRLFDRLSWIVWKFEQKHRLLLVTLLYKRRSVLIAMRDGVSLYTTIYSPRWAIRTSPFLMLRTAYGVQRYEKGMRCFPLAPSTSFILSGFHFVVQDVRGRHRSDGAFEHMRPQGSSGSNDSTDTYDTIEWLLKNVKRHNGKVGLWGISYQGFFCIASMIHAHPALKAASPQGPATDWFFDDFFHNGAFILNHAFEYCWRFDRHSQRNTSKIQHYFSCLGIDEYNFFLKTGNFKYLSQNALKGTSTFWNSLLSHPNYDSFWKARNILPHIENTPPAILAVGGWFDAEDLYGTFNLHQKLRHLNDGSNVHFVVGPWTHAGWSTAESRFGKIRWGKNNSRYFQRKIELPFFEEHLKGKKKKDLPNALTYDTGARQWREFSEWPPRNVKTKTLYFGSNEKLLESSETVSGAAAFVSDPQHPVPYTEHRQAHLRTQYMAEDQRFASRRPDVISFQTPPLHEPLTIAGPIQVKLFVSTTGTDADWIVKVIDVFPDDYKDCVGDYLGGYEMLVRAEVFRGRFRNGFETPEPFTPNQMATVSFNLQDILHTFKVGHRLMVQVQSSWFPLVDRNPQTFVQNIFEAMPDDFSVQTHRVFYGDCGQSKIEFFHTLNS